MAAENMRRNSNLDSNNVVNAADIAPIVENTEPVIKNTFEHGAPILEIKQEVDSNTIVQPQKILILKV